MIFTDTAKPLVMAGPCSAESERQVLDTARRLSAMGIGIFRAGVWKPRTKPGGFEGVGSQALPWLTRVREETGMLTATEVATRTHVREALAAGVDVLWIGARTSANPFAVQEIADTLAACPDGVREKLTVLVKNPVNPDLELWIGAMERIRLAGPGEIGAIHRGFSSYGAQLYRNPPKWRIPIELMRRMPGLPVICDPSHIGGRRDLIAPISQQAMDLNFRGLIIESHCDPDAALSDAAQQVTPEALKEILSSLVIRDASKPTDDLARLRGRIDEIDTKILELLAARMGISREIGAYKKQRDIAVIQPGRYNSLMQQRVEAAARLGLNEDFVRNILASVHEESVRQQL
ncbi:MAG: bifunctional 3-deoxy-7-phosphoheptulonate synthase/chorismate mutase type II [Bacteroides sp.]|nr:bifunctional 3-deoxy-7-phosphoheptulonate synthase/chorismate mutase type II [Bacteroides sp.]